jgi:hypothetical protein
MNIDSLVLGGATAYELQDRPDKSARTLRAMAYIAKQQVVVDSGLRSVKDAAKDIRSVIDQEKGFDSDTFLPLARLLEGRIDDAFLATTLGRGALAGTAAWGAAFASGPWTAAALAAGAVVADALITLPGVQDDLKILLGPRADDDLVFSLTGWASAQFFERLKSSPNAMNLAIDLQKTGHLPLDPKRTAESAVASLPLGMRTIVEPHVKKGASRPSARDTEAAVRNEVSNSLGALDKNSTELLNKVRDERIEAVRLQHEREAFQNAQSLVRELYGVGAVGNAVLGALGVHDVGQKLQGFVEAGADAYLTLVTPGLGPLAVAAGLIGSATKIFGLFGTSVDPLVVALAPINTKLDIILVRLDVIADHQRQILTNLREIYRTNIVNQVLIGSVQQQLSSLGRDLDAGQADLERQPFVLTKNNLTTMLANHEADSINNDENLAKSYREHVTNCVTWATETAKTSSQAGNPGTPKSEEQWLETIRRRARADRLMGVMPVVAGTLGVNLPQVPASHVFVAPIAWAEGTAGFLEGRIRAARVSFANERDLAKQLYLEGSLVRDAFRALTSATAFAAAGAKLREASGLPPEGARLKRDDLTRANSLAGLIFQAANDVDAEDVPRELLPQPAGASGAYAVGEVAPNDYYSTVNFRRDFFEELRNAGVIVLEDCQPVFIPNAGWSNCLMRLSSGSRKGELLAAARITFGFPRFFPATPGPLSPGQRFGAIELQRRSHEVWLEHVARPGFAQRASTEISRRLATAAFPTFEFWGEVLRLLATVLQWRMGNGDSANELLLDNSTGPFSLSEVQQHLRLFIEKELSPAGDWPLEIAAAFANYVTSSIAAWRTMAAAVRPEQSVPVVDETLRRLASYMIARGLTIPRT